jgi:hypothetical protein
MFEPKQHENTFLFLLRWAARLAAIVCLAIVFLFFFGEGINLQEISAREWVGLLFFPVGVFIGLVLAWQEEAIGGMITVASILGFYLIYGWLLSGSIRQGWAFLPFLIPGALFLLYGIISSVFLPRKNEKLSH